MYFLQSWIPYYLLVGIGQIAYGHLTKQNKNVQLQAQPDSKEQGISQRQTEGDTRSDQLEETTIQLRLLEGLLGGVGSLLDGIVGVIQEAVGALVGGLTPDLGGDIITQSPPATASPFTTSSAPPSTPPAPSTASPGTTGGEGVNKKCSNVQWPDPLTCQVRI